MINRSSNQDLGLVGELVGGHLQIQGCRSLPNPPADVVVAAVTRAEPPVVIPGAADGDASEVGAYPQHDEPLRLEDAVVVGLLVPQGRHGHGRALGDLGGGAVPDEHRLSPPLDGDGLADCHGADVEFSRGQSEDVGGRGHGRDELHDEHARRGGVREAHPGEEEVGEGAALGLCDAIDAIVGEAVIDGTELVEGRGLGGRGGRGV